MKTSKTKKMAGKLNKIWCHINMKGTGSNTKLLSYVPGWMDGMDDVKADLRIA